jgi:long-chain acyl-CoA synthetase
MLSEETKNKILQAHFVRGINPDDYLVKFRNIFELLQYRVHLQPDDTYIVFYPDKQEKISLTYKEFADKVFRTANLLKNNGIGIEDRIAAISHNHINTVIQYFAAWALGAAVVPINVNEEPDRIQYILKSSHTKLAFVNTAYLEKILEIQNELPDFKKIFVYDSTETTHRVVSTENSSNETVETTRRVVSTEKSFNGTLETIRGVVSEIEDYKMALEKESNIFEPDNNVNQETEALIVYTSGTTGLPKGVVLTQYNLLADADGISTWHKFAKGETMMCVLPIHHVNGTIVTLMTPMYYGGKTILNQKFHTHTFFERLAKEKVQVVSVVPTLLQFLCHDYEAGESAAGGKDFFHVYEEQLDVYFRHIICGAGPLTCELAVKFETMFGLKIIHGYGLSETTCYSCFLPVNLSNEEHTMWLNEFGFPSIGVEIEPNEMNIHNSGGESAAEGERGEIVIRGHNVMKYYLPAGQSASLAGDNNPDANSKTFEFGWFRSGDEGFYKKDAEGRIYFFITGRIKELIIRGGVNIAPLEIDEVLMSLPEVKAGIAVGFDNDWYGEEVGALVLLKDEFIPPLKGENSPIGQNAQLVSRGMFEEELKETIIKQCGEKLPFYKSPKVVIFTDSIPVTSTGKYQRNKVKYLFSEYKTVQFKGK